MKKFSLVMALVLAMSAFTACGGEGDTTTAPEGSKAPGATTTVAGDPTPQLTLPPIEPGTDEPDPGDLPYDVEAFPNATSGDIALEGYEAEGWFDDGVVTDGRDGGHAMFIFTNDTMASGKLTATFTGVEGSPSDSGIVFGMEEDIDEMYWFWENGPAYYMLFAADGGSLYLAKVGYQGTAWKELMITAEPIPGFVHGDEVTITAEFDGAGKIKGYANGELLIEYTDPAPLSGSRYGVRAEIIGVAYSSVIAEHN